jgi:hypothetical protein
VFTPKPLGKNYESNLTSKLAKQLIHGRQADHALKVAKSDPQPLIVRLFFSLGLAH